MALDQVRTQDAFGSATLHDDNKRWELRTFSQLFAFGEEAMSHASIFFITTAFIAYTAGVAVASVGRAGLNESLKGLLKIPVVYVVPLAFVFFLGWELPLPLMRSGSLLSDAAIPSMLLVLELQLQNNTHCIRNMRPLFFATGVRLLGGLGIGLLLAPLFGLKGLAYDAGVLESSMPRAVLSTILATEYDAEPVFVTTAVIASTLLSPLTLTPLLLIFGI